MNILIQIEKRGLKSALECWKNDWQTRIDDWKTYRPRKVGRALRRFANKIRLKVNFAFEFSLNQTPSIEVFSSDELDHNEYDVPVEAEVYINGKKASLLTDPRRDGNCRWVFANKKYVVKLNQGYGGQSDSEWELWNQIEPDDKKYFAKAVAHEPGGYVVQERVYFSYKKDRDGYSAAKEAIYEEILEPLEEKYELRDLSNNWGITTDGQPIIYDYGL